MFIRNQYMNEYVFFFLQCMVKQLGVRNQFQPTCRRNKYTTEFDFLQCKVKQVGQKKISARLGCMGTKLDRTEEKCKKRWSTKDGTWTLKTWNGRATDWGARPGSISRIRHPHRLIAAAQITSNCYLLSECVDEDCQFKPGLCSVNRRCGTKHEI